MPDEIARDPELLRALEQLPKNYNLQVAKTVWRLKSCGAKRVALQLPEGLLLFALALADIFEQLAGVEQCVVLADVTYGACCIDDWAARALGCDFLVHYGHSCLVPIDVTARADQLGGALQVMYVFVDIDIDAEHLAESVKLTLPDREAEQVALLGTIQFAGGLHAAKQTLDAFYARPCVVPQAKPLSRGEVLGCTSPTLAETPGAAPTAMVFVADGRFHLESAMIANPGLRAYRYNPYDKSLSEEQYDTPLMLRTRLAAVEQARRARRWGVVLGTLGRQGNPAILQRLERALRARGHEVMVLLISEMSPQRLALMDAGGVEAWVQVACPRLSVDWGASFSRPLLTPYECFVALGLAQWNDRVYPQDYYKRGSGPWTNYYQNDDATKGPGPASVSAEATAPASTTTTTMPHE